MVLILSLGFVASHGEGTFSEAEQLIESKISCDDLSEDQLEIIGDYYMEQMHPGELHEIMDARMGGEGSETLRQAHINMALSFYCGEHGEVQGSMMDIMMGRNSNYGPYGMMSGDYQYFNNSYNLLIVAFQISFIVILILAIVFLIKKLKEPESGRRR